MSVFGGELASLDGVAFRDPTKLDIVGIYPNYAGAYAAWKAKAQQTVDNAHMRYFIVHVHRLLDGRGGGGAMATTTCGAGYVVDDEERRRARCTRSLVVCAWDPT